MTGVCATLAVGVFVAALAARTSMPSVETLPAAGNMRAPAAVLVAEASFTLEDTNLALRLYQDAGQRTVQLEPQAGQAVRGADVLVYWHATGGDGQRLPDDAYLLGTMAGAQAREFSLPARTNEGVLLFYSLATQTLYAQRLALPVAIGAR